MWINLIQKILTHNNQNYLVMSFNYLSTYTEYKLHKSFRSFTNKNVITELKRKSINAQY